MKIRKEFKIGVFAVAVILVSWCGLVPIDLVFQRRKLGFVFRGNTGIDDHSGFSKCCVHYAISFSASTVN